MGHGKPPYAAEYRQQMVELVRAGRKPRGLAREFECSATTIRDWVRQADLDEGLREDGLTTVERDELRRLRRENRQLREEREILKNGTSRRLPGRMETGRAAWKDVSGREQPSAFWRITTPLKNVVQGLQRT